MHKPVSNLDKEILARFEKAGMVPPVDRWESKMGHRPEAEGLAKTIASIDWLFFGDVLNLRFGGDGDTGEELIFILDAMFDLIEAENNLKAHQEGV